MYLAIDFFSFRFFFHILRPTVKDLECYKYDTLGVYGKAMPRLKIKQQQYIYILKKQAIRNIVFFFLLKH